MNKLDISCVAFLKRCGLVSGTPYILSNNTEKLYNSVENAYPKKQHIEYMYTLQLNIPRTITLRIIGI
jgi:hypothetical protein